MKPTLINLPKILGPRGNLTFVEGQCVVPGGEIHGGDIS